LDLKKRMSNIEQGIMNVEGQDKPSVFDIPCSIFDIQRFQKEWEKRDL
jgi:hypothetical protein